MSDADSSGAAEVVPVTEYNKILEKARNEEARAVDYEKRFKGIDPERVKAEREELEILRRQSIGNDPDKIKQHEEKIRSEYDQRYSAKLGEYEGITKQQANELKELRVTNTAMSKAAAIFNDDALDLIQDRVRADCDWQDGKIIVKDKDGKPRPSVKNPREDMGVDEYLETLANKYPSTAKPTSVAGSKSGGQKSSGTTGTKSLSIEELRRQPDGGKQMMQEAGAEAVRKLFT